MSNFYRCILVACFLFFVSWSTACSRSIAGGSVVGDSDTAHASDGAQGMPGAQGVFDFKPNDWIAKEKSWWKDTDGVNPGVAGCHIGTDAQGKPNGRMFGEACLPGGILVESNPGKDELHSHENDTGHPDTFDCNDWCVGNGEKSGMCKSAIAPPCEQSALCVCLT